MLGKALVFDAFSGSFVGVWSVLLGGAVMVLLAQENWRKLVLQEKRWHRRVVLEVSRREAPKEVSRKLLIAKILAGLMSAIFLNYWKKKGPRIVFVGFGQSSLTESMQRKLGDDVVLAENTPDSVIAGQSLIELDALSYLLNHPDLLPKFVRKCLLHIFKMWLERVVQQFSGAIFFVKEDYYGKSSVLVTISGLMNVRVVGIQHGLLRHSYLAETDIYPGYRTLVECVYSKEYMSLVLDKKPSNAKVYLLGVPFDSGVRRIESLKPERRIIFISSGDLQSEARRRHIMHWRTLASDNGYDFFVRPHPSERGVLNNFGFPFATQSKDEVLSMSVNTVIFVGFFSTLLYEAGHMGFKTVWLTDTGSEPAIDQLPEIRGLVNCYAAKCSDVSSAWLRAVMLEELVDVEYNPVSERMLNFIESLRQ